MRPQAEPRRGGNAHTGTDYSELLGFFSETRRGMEKNYEIREPNSKVIDFRVEFLSVDMDRAHHECMRAAFARSLCADRVITLTGYRSELAIHWGFLSKFQIRPPCWKMADDCS